MFLQIYSVVERTPPINEPVFRVVVGKEGEIAEIVPCRAIFQEVSEGERGELPDGIHPQLVWDMGDLGAFDMKYTDHWMFRRAMKGGV